MTPISHAIPAYAIKCHADTNHLYDNKHPYVLHLSMAVAWAYKFLYLLPIEYQNDVVGAIWNHDVLEDCRISYSELKMVAGKRVADLVYAVTNDKGHNRKERASDKHYEEMGKIPYANFVKLCDRLANVQYSLETKHHKLDMYKQEVFPLKWTQKTFDEYGHIMMVELEKMLKQ